LIDRETSHAEQLNRISFDTSRLYKKHLTGMSNSLDFHFSLFTFHF